LHNDVTTTYEVFDYESVYAEQQIAELRSNNLLRFIQIVLKDIIIKNLTTDFAEKKAQRDCEHFFSQEIMLMSFKAHLLLQEKVQALQKK